MNTFLIGFIPILLQTEEIGFYTLAGFVILVGGLIMILTKGKPRTPPTIVQTQSPQQWTDDPKIADTRRRAVAAAYAFHQHPSSTGTQE